MKRTLFLAAVALMSAGAFAQMANVKLAKKLTSKKDFDGARAAIVPALTNEETKNLTETWFVAGEIGYKQLQAEVDKIYEQPGYKPNYEVLGPAILESCKYYEVADSLALVPTLDKKGREVVDTKTHKTIQSRLLKYFEEEQLAVYGSTMAQKDDDKGIYDGFSGHVAIPYMKAMQDEKMQAKMPKDSVFQSYMYYAANYAFRIKDYKAAAFQIERMLEIENVERELTVTEYLYEAYKELKDSTNMLRTLERGMKRFPQESWFVQNMINYYFESGKTKEAIESLNLAIEKEPDGAQYYRIRGVLYENMEQYDKALADYKKFIELEPANPLGYQLMATATGLKAKFFEDHVDYRLTGKAYDAAMKTKDELYAAAIPYWEKAVELAPDDLGSWTELKKLYYRFIARKGMQTKYDAAMKRIKELQNK
ncbi:MAG: tetratricopeptide repeat protein [Paludibacteraceae bacterium]|nr:tetratricopeptide repeat protein [Paludibacteraceae bacterium]